MPKFNGNKLQRLLWERDQWVCWREEERNGKTTKLPIKPYDSRDGTKEHVDEDHDSNGDPEDSHPFASSTHPHTWRSFEEAKKYHEEGSEKTEGIGFVFTPDDVVLGLDLDDCRDPETGNTEEWAKDIIGRLNSYTEVSPSGEGYHIYIVGVVPGDDHRAVQERTLDYFEEKPEIEVYDWGRYFTYTGDHHAGTPDEVKQRNSEFKDVYREYIEDGNGEDDDSEQTTLDSPDLDLDDEEVIQKAEDAKNGDKFERLHRGHDIANDSGRSDTSYADKSYLQLLAFWTGGDRNQMDRIFRNSGRMRSKWDEDRGKQTYGERTLDAAIADQTEFYNPGKGDDNTPPPPPRDDREDAESDSDDSDGDGGGGGGPNGNGNGDDWDDRTGWGRVVWLYEQDDVKNVTARHTAVERLRRKHDFATTKDTEELYIYDPETGVFEDNGEIELKHTLDANLGKWYTRSEVKEIMERVKAESIVDRSEFDGGRFDDPLVCVGNGVLNVRTRELTDHSPEHLFTKSIPVEYDETGQCPNVDAFMDEITGRNEDRLTLYEMIGMSLLPRYTYNAFLILYGEGQNGKSTYFDLVERFLGTDNISEADLKMLAENRFAKAQLAGKMANIAPDIDQRKINELGTIKALTGGDTIMAEKKGKPSFSFENAATLMFGCNEPPVFGERSHAIARRLMPIELPFRFTNDEDDGNPMARDRQKMVEEMTTDEELSGLLNEALDALDRLKADGFSLPEGPRERMELYESSSDPILKFSSTCLEKNIGNKIPKNVVYDTYKNFCDSERATPTSKSVFFKQLKQTPIKYDEARPTINGERVTCVTDTAFSEHGLRHTDEMNKEKLGLGDTEDENETKTDSSVGVNDVVPLRNVQPEMGYITVRAKVAVLGRNNDDDGRPRVQGVLLDETDMVDFLSWEHHDFTDMLEEGNAYEFKGVKMVHRDQREPRITMNGATTEAKPIQIGSDGVPENTDPENRTLGDVDEDRDDLRWTVLQKMDKMDDGDGVTIGKLAAELSSETDPSTVEDVISRLSESGKVYQISEDKYSVNN